MPEEHASGGDGEMHDAEHAPSTDHHDHDHAPSTDHEHEHAPTTNHHDTAPSTDHHDHVPPTNDEGSGNAAAMTHTVFVNFFDFSPREITITAGDTVLWDWVDDTSAHTVTSDTPGLFGSAFLLGADQSFTHTFNNVGVYGYYCIPHGSPGGVGMAGTVEVLAPLSAISGGPYSVAAGSSVVLDRAYPSTPGPYTYSWDLDNDGVFGEAGTLYGSEAGLTPTFNAAGLFAGASLPVTFRVHDGANTVDSATMVNVIAASPVLIIDNSSAAGFALTGQWAAGGGPDVGRGGNVYVAFGESFHPTDVATWTFNLDGPGRYRVSATWYTDTGFPQLFAGAARFEVSDSSTVRDTALINQQVVPGDFTDAGSAWEDLGAFDISGSTLTVKLLSSSDDQTYVVADAIRIEKIANLSPHAEIQVTANGQVGVNVPDGTGNVSFGTASFHVPVQKTFAITNIGAAPLTLSPLTVSGLVFTIVTEPSAGPLGPGQSTTFVMEMDASTTGPHTETVSFDGGDGNENPFDFMVSGTVLTANVIDDRHPLHAPTGYVDGPGGFWGTVSTGFANDYRYAQNIAGVDEVGTYTFDVTPGQYRVSATWPFAGGADFSNAAPFTVFNGNLAGAVVGGRNLDQKNTTPNDRLAFNTNWDDIGIVNITGASLTVRVQSADAPSQFVFADAVMIERLGPVPTGPEVVVVENNRNANAGTINYGVTQLGHSVDKTYTITNRGTSSLTISPASFTVPTGYTLVSPPSASLIPAGGSAPFVVRMTGTVAGIKAGNITFTTNDSDEGTVSISVTGEVVTHRLIDDQNVADGYSDSGMTHEPNSPISYRGDVSYANTSALQGPASATWTFSNVPPGSYYVALTWFETGGNTLWASNTQLIVQDGGVEVGNLRFSQQNGPTGALSFPLDGANWQILHFFDVTSPTVTVTVTNANVDGLILADGVLINGAGGPIPPGNGASGGGDATSRTAEPSSGGALRADDSPAGAVDEALVNTAFWNDEMEDVATLLAEDSTREDSTDDLPARRMDELEKDELALELSDLLVMLV